MTKKISQILLLLSMVISLVGAIYIALVHHAYMISFCFVVAAVLLMLRYQLPNKKKKDRKRAKQKIPLGTKGRTSILSC